MVTMFETRKPAGEIATHPAGPVQRFDAQTVRVMYHGFNGLATAQAAGGRFRKTLKTMSGSVSLCNRHRGPAGEHKRPN